MIKIQSQLNQGIYYGAVSMFYRFVVFVYHFMESVYDSKVISPLVKGPVI